MHSLIILLLLTSLTTMAAAADHGHPATRPDVERREKSFGQIPLHFIENQGQFDDEVCYCIQGAFKTFYFTEKGITCALTRRTRTQGKRNEFGTIEPTVDPESTHEYDRYLIAFEFAGARKAKPVGREKQKAIFSYFKGRPQDWNTGIPTYRQILYENLWPGIDLIYSLDGDRLKNDFIIEPGTDPDQIRIALHGTSCVSLDEHGKLIIETPVDSIEDGIPCAYQIAEDVKCDVQVKYRLEESTQGYGFALGDYDPDLPLIIDPEMIVYCGYIGGEYSDEQGTGIEVDEQGCAYVGGFTNSLETSFPAKVGPDLTSNGSIDAFVAKVSADGTELIYCGYIGGEWDDRIRDLAVDHEGNAYVAGRTNSSENSMPVIVGPDLTYNWGITDGFVAKVSADGKTLLYCGYLGGDAADECYGIAVDSVGRAYLTGDTKSKETTFPVVVGPDLTYNGNLKNCDSFIARVNPDGSALDYCGYIGGASVDEAFDVAVDDSGKAYVTGSTRSDESSFPVKNGPDLTFNGFADVFVARVNAHGSALDFCGYLGGSTKDYGRAIALDSQGNVYLTGDTYSDEKTFPVAIGPDLTFNSGNIDAFVARIDPDGASIDYCGYIGGRGYDWGRAIEVDGYGNAHVVGYTYSNEDSFPVNAGPDLTQNGLRDVFAAKVNAQGSGLIYCGYIGGANDDFAHAASLDGAANLYLTGHTWSSEAEGFPLLNGPDLTFNGAHQDPFVAKLCLPTLMTHRKSLTASTGGEATFYLNASMSHANRNYLLLGSASGTDPGTPLPGGHEILPLNWDCFTELVLYLIGSPYFQQFNGVLDAWGAASAQLDTQGPLCHGSIGHTLYFSYCLNHPFDFASNPVAIEIVP